MSALQENVAKQIVKRCKNNILFSFFSRKIFTDFNEIVKRQRKICDAFALQFLYTSTHTMTRQKKFTLILKNYRLISRKKTSQSRNHHTTKAQWSALNTFAFVKRRISIAKDITKRIFIIVRLTTNIFIIVYRFNRFISVALVFRKLVVVVVFFDLIRSVKIINNIRDIIRVIIVSLLLLFHEEQGARRTLCAWIVADTLSINRRVERYREHFRVLISRFKIIFFLIEINIIRIRLNLNLKNVNTATFLRDANDLHVEQNNRRCE